MPEEALESTQAGLQDGCLNEFGNETTPWSFVFPLRDVAKEDVEGIGSKRRANLLEAGFWFDLASLTVACDSFAT